MRTQTKIAIGGLSLILLGLAAYLVFRPEFCDGLPRELGACSSSRPSYVGTTCDEVAKEWGTQLDERVVAVIDGPDEARGQGRSSLLYDAEILTTQLANKHLRDSGLTPSCNAEQFLAIGETAFSELTIDEVGATMYEGDPVVSYGDWLARQADLVSMILMEPDTPYAP